MPSALDIIQEQQTKQEEEDFFNNHRVQTSLSISSYVCLIVSTLLTFGLLDNWLMEDTRNWIKKIIPIILLVAWVMLLIGAVNRLKKLNEEEDKRYIKEICNEKTT